MRWNQTKMFKQLNVKLDNVKNKNGHISKQEIYIYN